MAAAAAPLSFNGHCTRQSSFSLACPLQPACSLAAISQIATCIGMIGSGFRIKESQLVGQPAVSRLVGIRARLANTPQAGEAAAAERKGEATPTGAMGRSGAGGEAAGTRQQQFGSMDEFWGFYLSQHSKPGTRRWHFLGTLASLACAALAAATGRAAPLLASCGSSLLAASSPLARRKLPVAHRARSPPLAGATTTGDRGLCREET